MLDLEELRFSGIGRFVEEQVVDFSEFGDFVQLDGLNKNTGGSSGAAKTTVFNAYDYLLGLNDLPTTVLQSRLTKNGISVTGKHKWNGIPVEITRSKSGLKLDINGEIVEGSNALAEEKLDQILGMSRDLFRKILHKRQKEGGFFLDFTPKDKHEFLGECMNLSEFRKKNEIVDNLILNNTRIVNDTKSHLIAAKAGLSATQDAILSLGLVPTNEVSKEMIFELKEKYDRSGIRLKTVQEKLELENKQLSQDRPNTSVVGYDAKNRETLERRGKEIEAQISKTLSNERSRQEGIREIIHHETIRRGKLANQVVGGSRAKADAAKIAAEVKQIKNSICPTCTQGWTTQSSKDAEKNKMSELIALKELIVLGSLAEVEIKKIDEKLPGYELSIQPIIDSTLLPLKVELENITQSILEEKQKERAWIESQNVTNRELMADFEGKQVILRIKHTAELMQFNGQLDVDRRVFETAVGRFKAYEEAMSRYETSLKSLKSKEENFTKQILDLEQAIISLETQLLLAEESRKAIKMFVSYSFDSALESIGDGATKIIRCIPNMKCATIRFEGTKETKEGKIKEEVNAIIDMDGEIGIPIKSLSGGERSAVDLAVDLAVIDFIETKSGMGSNLFILDEPFTGLGTVEIEMAMEVLKNSNLNKKLIIVDHNPEVKEMVQDRILVIRDGLTSKIEKVR